MRKISTFYILVITQIISIIGSKMTGIAISIEIFTDTGNSTPILFTMFFATVPSMLAATFAGTFADRWPRKQLLILTFMVTLIVYAWPRCRRLEADLPDYATLEDDFIGRMVTAK